MEYPYDISTEEMELIERFHAGELLPEELTAFNDRLETDSIWRRKVDEVKWLLLGIQEASLKQRLESFHSAIPVNHITVSKTRVLPMARRILVAASLLLLVSLSLWWFLGRTSASGRLYSRYYQTDPGLVTAMGNADDYAFEKAMVDYKNGNYKEALASWAVQLSRRPSSDTLQYFTAAAQQALGNEKEAISLLEKVANNASSSFKYEACWYLGLAYLKLGDRDRAIQYITLSDHTRRLELLKILQEK